MRQKRIQQALRSTQSDQNKLPHTFTRGIDAGATLVIALLAFILSYSKLVGLAERAGYSPNMAHLWPLIVDGLAVVATLGVLRLSDARYAWTLLGSSTAVSVVAAVASAMFPAGPLPPVAAALVSIVPPLCLLVAPHLAVQLMREGRVATPVAPEEVAPGQLAAIATEIEEWKAVEARKRYEEGVRRGAEVTNSGGRSVENFPQSDRTPPASDEAGQMLGVSGRSVRDAKYVKQNDPETFEKIKTGEVAPEPVAPQLFAIPDRRTTALQLIADGMSQRAAAKTVGVSDTTVRRWRAQAS